MEVDTLTSYYYPLTQNLLTVLIIWTFASLTYLEAYTFVISPSAPPSLTLTGSTELNTILPALDNGSEVSGDKFVSRRLFKKKKKRKGSTAEETSEGGGSEGEGSEATAASEGSEHSETAESETGEEAIFGESEFSGPYDGIFLAVAIKALILTNLLTLILMAWWTYAG